MGWPYEKIIGKVEIRLNKIKINNKGNQENCRCKNQRSQRKFIPCNWNCNGNRTINVRKSPPPPLLFLQCRLFQSSDSLFSLSFASPPSQSRSWCFTGPSISAAAWLYFPKTSLSSSTYSISPFLFSDSLAHFFFYWFRSTLCSCWLGTCFWAAKVNFCWISIDFVIRNIDWNSRTHISSCLP